MDDCRVPGPLAAALKGQYGKPARQNADASRDTLRLKDRRVARFSESEKNSDVKLSNSRRARLRIKS